MSFASMDNLIILSWNVRGLNDRALRDNVHTLVDDVRASVVCLQETKLDDVPTTLMLSMLGVWFANFTYIPASNTRGGVLVAARHPDIALSKVHLGCFSLTVMVSTQPATPAATTASAMPSTAAQASPSVPPITMAPEGSFWLTSVYGPQSDAEKDLFLEELAAIRAAYGGPWLIIGDFNLILSEEDKNNSRINRRNLRNFRRFVASCELQDLHLHGRSYTWSNELDNPTLVKLDRALVSLNWEEAHPHCLL